MIAAIGSHLTHVERSVLRLGDANDEYGHAATTLWFGRRALTIEPGPDEDFIRIREGAAMLDPEFWTLVDFDSKPPVSDVLGKALAGVECHSRQQQDVAVVLVFAERRTPIVIALTDSDLVIGNDFRVFGNSLPEPLPRLRIRAGVAWMD